MYILKPAVAKQDESKRAKSFFLNLHLIFFVKFIGM